MIIVAQKDFFAAFISLHHLSCQPKCEFWGHGVVPLSCVLMHTYMRMCTPPPTQLILINIFFFVLYQCLSQCLTQGRWLVNVHWVNEEIINGKVFYWSFNPIPNFIDKETDPEKLVNLFYITLLGSIRSTQIVTFQHLPWLYSLTY